MLAGEERVLYKTHRYRCAEFVPAHKCRLEASRNFAVELLETAILKSGNT